MALITTVGGATANSYATLGEAETYFEGRLDATEWTAAEGNDDLKERALIWATVLLDRAFNWAGSARDEVQRLAWPRTGMVSANGFTLSSSVIPLQLKEVQIEFAFMLMKGDRTSSNAGLSVIGAEQGLTALKVGGVFAQWSDNKFTSLEDFDTYVRSLGSDMNYLNRIVPNSVRFMVPPAWYKESTLKKSMIFGAI